MPCGGCKFCSKLHDQWNRFEEYVDDVIPLAQKNLTDSQNQNFNVNDNLQDSNLTVSHTQEANVTYQDSNLKISQIKKKSFDTTCEDSMEAEENEKQITITLLIQKNPEEWRELQLQDSDLSPIFQ